MRSGPIELITNAPADWPRVWLEGPLTAHTPTLHFITAVETCFRGSQLQVLEADVVRVTRQGVLVVPLRVRAPDGEYDLFFYPEADEKAAGHFMAVYEIARKFGRLKPVFYSTDDLFAIYPDDVGEVARQDRLFIQASLMPPRGQYAMWWAEQPGERFELSPTYGLIDRLYREISGLEFSAFAQLLIEIGMIQSEEEATAYTFPDQTVEIPLQGPEGVPIILSFSQARGIRFHFHTQRTPPEYRELFLNLALLRFKLWKKQPEIASLPRLESPPLLWWQDLGKRLRSLSDDQAIGAVGSVKR
ncbi:hypothetical protein [Calidithermus roseus]|uniref:Uncharacterized protein n=1 Tax=Calidithermus roseus TaxID=1644118 RepID=A0A399ERZ0_9DEIN|nr:hypothetical protein [Calidithermus roseus]RIH86310.1 hypothetical protein Mrose_01850 [Calidithermus roseus]